MPRTPHVQAVTANDLLVGDVIYLTDSGDWSGRIAEAALARSPAHAEALLAAAAAQVHQVVGAYLIDVRLTADGPTPAHFREKFRACGPSNYFHGKQAEGANVSV